MTNNILAISNLFPGTIGTGASQTKAKAVEQRNQISQTTGDDTPVSNDSGTITVDDTPVRNHNRLKTELPGEFKHTFRREITTKVAKKARLRQTVQNQEQLFLAAGRSDMIQPMQAKWSLKTVNGPKGIAKKVELKAGLERAQLHARLNLDKSPLPAGDTTKAEVTKPITLMNQKQIELKGTSPKVPQDPLSIQSNKDESANRIQMPEIRPLAAGGIGSEHNDKGLTLQPLIRAHHRITTADGKPEDVPVSNTFENQQTPTLGGIGLKPQVLVNAAGEITNVVQKPAIAHKQDVAAVQKKPSSNPNISPVQDKSTGLQFQAVRIETEKLPLIAENRIANKTGVGQPIRNQTQQFSGPLGGDVIEQGPNTSGNQAHQHLHRAQLEMTTGPLKIRDNSTSGNNNADSDFGHILSSNNTATYVEEQISIFPEAVRTDNQPVQNLSNDVSASIAGQILESIQNSSSQDAGTQQITIRLHPPELGKVFIKFEEQENQLTGLVEVTKTQTRYEVEQALPQIVQNLADCGIQIKRLEVMLTNQNGQQSYGEESLHDGSFQQHHHLPEWDNPDHPGTIDTDERGMFENSGSYQDSLEAQMQITADSINMLI